jgi:hypothetical protein
MFTGFFSSLPIHLREVSRYLRQFPDENAELM